MVYGLGEETFQFIYRTRVDEKELLIDNSKNTKSIQQDKSVDIESRWNS